MRARGAGPQPLVAAIRVEQIALHGRSREAELLALSVHGHEIRAGLSELRERDGLAVQSSGRASGLDLARQHEIVQAAREDRFHASALGAFAHHARRHPPAGRGKKRVNEYRLAGAGLAGQHGEPCV